ncbi:glycosyl hydrolase [Micromonosporaceae bacterium Da 78-11]
MPRVTSAAGSVLTVVLLLLVTGFVAVVAGPAAAAGPATYEAENGRLQGVQVSTTTPGYSGTGAVAGFDAPDDAVTVTVPSGAEDLYDVVIRYHSPYGTKKTQLLLNGAVIGEIELSGSTGFTDAPAGRLLLRAGDNSITLRNDWGYYEIDALRLSPAPPRPPHQLDSHPVNPAATPAAASLLSYLGAHYGHDILSGQQDTAGIQWLRQNVGKAPAIGGFDLMDYSPSRVERGAAATTVEQAVDWDRQGGITTVVWHWNAPAGLIDQPGNEWWRGFYTSATTFDVAAALADPGSADYRLLLRDIDAIAVQLGRLQDAGVPVLWRPLHEAEGGWFWWGAHGAGPAKQLYRLMYDRLTRLHHLNNLIWVWNSVDPAWYPGDDVVDIVSNDSYPAQADDHGPVSSTYEKLVALGGDRKPAALAEVGTIPDPALIRAYRADWSYFVTWGGDFLTDGVHNPIDFLNRVYHDPQVITLDRVGDFKHFSPAARTGPITAPGGTCVDLPGAVNTNGTRVQLWPCNGTGAQQWTSGGDRTLRALGKCLDITATAGTAWGTANGAPVELWDCWGGPMQQWVQRSDGSLLNPNSGRCLDDPAGDRTPGTKLQIWDCNHLPPQLFDAP